MTPQSRSLPDGGALLIVGSTSGAGKSTVTAALGRSLSRTGRSVAPFKAQNMSNHAAVTSDGGEIGRAQAMQAAACGVAPDRRMNPILLKPTSDQRSHVVVMGEESERVDAWSYGETAARLKPVVLDAFTSLRRTYPWVVAEGAGGAAEINLLERDLVNLPLAAAAGVKAVLVVDIDRGGAFASAYGTIELVPAALRSTIGGIIFNRFRGDVSLLDDGVVELERRSGVPVLGVLPALEPAPRIGLEDSLDIETGPPTYPTTSHEQTSPKPVRVAGIRLPHLANPSDADPFVVEPDVEFRWVSTPGGLAETDLIILPGSRATVSDLTWLRSSGMSSAIEQASLTGSILLGLCAGYQMLGTSIIDEVESAAGHVPGLAMLNTVTEFDRPKIVRTSKGQSDYGPIAGYQIRFGRPRLGSSKRDRADVVPWLVVDGEPEGAAAAQGTVFGTSLHGLLDADEFRHGFLDYIAERRQRIYQPSSLGFGTALEDHHDRLADWLEASVDRAALLSLAADAVPVGAEPGWR